MIWYNLEITILDKNETGMEKMNYSNEYNRPDCKAGFDLISQNVKITRTGFISFGIIARLIKVEPMPNSHIPLETDSPFWLIPNMSIYNLGLIMGNSLGVIDKTFREELKAPVWSMKGEIYVTNDSHFQIVAPDMGWIRNVYFV